MQLKERAASKSHVSRLSICLSEAASVSLLDWVCERAQPCVFLTECSALWEPATACRSVEEDSSDEAVPSLWPSLSFWKSPIIREQTFPKIKNELIRPQTFTCIFRLCSSCTLPHELKLSDKRTYQLGFDPFYALLKKSAFRVPTGLPKQFDGVF